MKNFYVLAAIVATFGFSDACGNTNENSRENRAVNARSNLALPVTPTPSRAELELKAKVEAEMRKNGFSKITFDTSTSPPTLRGEYPKGRLAEVIQTARLASGGEVQNGASESR